jgi:hypothetical protein
MLNLIHDIASGVIINGTYDGYNAASWFSDGQWLDDGSITVLSPASDVSLEQVYYTSITAVVVNSAWVRLLTHGCC